MGLIDYGLSSNKVKPKTSLWVGISRYQKGAREMLRGPVGAFRTPQRFLTDHYIGIVCPQCLASQNMKGLNDFGLSIT